MNLVVLCPEHHDLADHDTEAWSIERLEELKRRQEIDAQERLGIKPWKSAFAAVHYLNVPRLAWLATTHGMDWPLPSEKLPGGSEELIRYMAAAEAVLRRLHPLAASLDRGFRPADLPLGSLGAFNRGVRTKGYRVSGEDVRGQRVTGDWRSDPQVYFNEGSTRVVLPIDPAYITSRTAASAFSSGQTAMAGLCQVKMRVDEAEGQTVIVASPLVLGVESPLMEEIFDRPRPPQAEPSPDDLPF